MDFLSYFSSWFDYFMSMMVGFQDKEASLVVIGLDNAGKTTLLHRLRTGTDGHTDRDARKRRKA